MVDLFYSFNYKYGRINQKRICMKTSIVHIGNCRGTHLPGSVIEQSPRSGWSDACFGMRSQADDTLLDHDYDISVEWDQSEWRWWNDI